MFTSIFRGTKTTKVAPRRPQEAPQDGPKRVPKNGSHRPFSGLAAKSPSDPLQTPSGPPLDPLRTLSGTPPEHDFWSSNIKHTSQTNSAGDKPMQSPPLRRDSPLPPPGLSWMVPLASPGLESPLKYSTVLEGPLKSSKVQLSHLKVLSTKGL